MRHSLSNLRPLSRASFSQPGDNYIVISAETGEIHFESESASRALRYCFENPDTNNRIIRETKEVNRALDVFNKIRATT